MEATNGQLSHAPTVGAHRFCGATVVKEQNALRSRGSITCPYHPLDGIGEYRRDHPWRKPKPGMLLQAASDLGLDPARCAILGDNAILGDKMSDMEAGGRPGLVSAFSS